MAIERLGGKSPLDYQAMQCAPADPGRRMPSVPAGVQRLLALSHELDKRTRELADRLSLVMPINVLNSKEVNPQTSGFNTAPTPPSTDPPLLQDIVSVEHQLMRVCERLESLLINLEI